MPSRIAITAPEQGFPDSSFRYTPLRHVRVLFVSFLQGLFAKAPPGSFRWEEDSEKTEIVIRDESPINVNTVEKRPAINITLGTVQFFSLGMDDLISYDFDTGRKVKSVLVPGTVSINCCSRSDIECHDLAWVISEHIWLLRELFLKMGFFELGRGNQITPPSAAGSIVTGDSGDEWYCSTVSIPYQFQRKSAFTPLGKEIVQSILQRLETVSRRVESMGAPQGRAITNCFPPNYAPDASDAGGRTPDPGGVRDVFLPKQPHPLNPAKTVTVRVMYPNRAGARALIRPPGAPAAALPLVRPCVKESG